MSDKQLAILLEQIAARVDAQIEHLKHFLPPEKIRAAIPALQGETVDRWPQLDGLAQLEIDLREAVESLEGRG